MGKKKQSTGLGKAIIRDRFGKKDRKAGGETFLHTSELNDGYDWGRLNLQSVTEQNNLEEFLTTAELAGTEFTAEKLNIKFVSKDTGLLPHPDEVKAIKGLHKEHENLLRIPRRPPWTKQMSASEVDQNERAAFLDWRRSLASLQEDERIIMTPYEKNLDFWRQLWRVIERSDIVVQIVDARNPLLFYCQDLEAYVKEVDSNKICMVLVNKADFLNQEQREAWANYFTERGIRIAFWSAVEESNRQEQLANSENEAKDNVKEEDENSDEDADEEVNDSGSDSDNRAERIHSVFSTKLEVGGEHDESALLENSETADLVESDVEEKLLSDRDNIKERKTVHFNENVECAELNAVESEANSGEVSTESVESSTEISDISAQSDDISRSTADTDSCICTPEDKSHSPDCCVDRWLMKKIQLKNSSKIYTGPELLKLFRSLHVTKKVHEGYTTVGMVGYPNVGKSSTINAILKMKKVPVSATPGRTKHFQTLYVDPTLMLCDCPGLVFPSFVTTKADLVINGVLSIDQMRDSISPTALVCQKIPRWMLEYTYGINIPHPQEGEDPNRPPTAYELLNAYGAMRGFMTNNGQPDCPRSSRYILKDFVNGKLLYCHPPPDQDPVQFNGFHEKEPAKGSQLPEGAGSQGAQTGSMPNALDSEFFRKGFSTVHVRSARGTSGSSSGSGTPGSSQTSLNEKPWKKHNNRNKREKLRRVYAHLDKQ